VSLKPTYKAPMNDYQIVPNHVERVWELYCNDFYVASYNSLDVCESQRDLLEHEDELAERNQ